MTSSHNMTVIKAKAHTNVIGNDEANKLAKEGALELQGTKTPFWSSIPPQHNTMDQS